MSSVEPHNGQGKSGRKIGPARIAAILVGVVVLGFVALLATRAPIGDPVRVSPILGKEAPDFSGPSIFDGKEISLKQQLATKKYLLLNFFASTCIPCVQEHPELVTISKKYSADLSIVSVMFNENATDAKNFFKARGGNWPVIDSPRTSVDYGVALIPETFLIDPAGTVLYKASGPIKATEFDALFADARSRAAS